MIVKVCGMREPENIRQVEGLGVQMMGFIFYTRSPRFVPVVPEYLPHCQRVGVFVDSGKDAILMRDAALELDFIQLHGHESPDYVRDLRMILPRTPIIKAFSISQAADFQQVMAYEGLCAYYLFDTKCDTVGGSGTQWDWQLLEAYHGETPFLLSGGIGPDSVEALQQLHHPLFAGIDLNSRFETEPAVKDVNRLAAFLQEIQK